MHESKEVDLALCINVKVRVTNDSTDFQKAIDAKVAVVEWLREETLPKGEELDISYGSGEVEIINLESIRAEIM